MNAPISADDLVTGKMEELEITQYYGISVRAKFLTLSDRIGRQEMDRGWIKVQDNRT